ncbi:MAG: 5-(carboxyamino)imidazole ribonucleotide synthase [Stappiaceae bacterium]
MIDQLILKPGDTVGMLGGGQLGRMMAIAAARLGLKVHTYCPDPDSPAFEVSVEQTVADYEDEKALATFARSVSVVTYEFENVPKETVAILSKHVPVRPGAYPLAVSQDRLSEKQFLADLGIKVAPFYAVDEPADLTAAARLCGLPAILKTRRFGYDGKGQTTLSALDEANEVFQEIGSVPAILEGRIDFIAECSVLVARNHQGAAEVYDITENVHQNHILKWSRVPARCLPPEVKVKAQQLGLKIAEALNYIGLLAVELFVERAKGGEIGLVVNEIAPRVHNSGHWTEDGCLVSQFEQHIRAVAGWPLGNPDRISDVEMENLIGADADNWFDILCEPDTHLHLYGKKEIRPGRKMGHVNRLKRSTSAVSGSNPEN